MTFADADDAARQLAERLRGAAPEFANPTVVIGVGDDGKRVAEPLAAALALPLGDYAVGQMVLPWRPKLAFGALTDDNHHYTDAEIVTDHSLGAREQGQLARALLASLRARRPARPKLAGERVLIVGAALSTGYRVLAVAASVKAAGAAGVMVAAPCAARDAVERVAAARLPVLCLVVSDGPLFDAASFYAR